MVKLEFLILFIFFIQVVPNIVDVLEDEQFLSETTKCIDFASILYKTETADKCIARSSLLSKEGNIDKCCFYSFKKDPIDNFRKKYGDNWKIIAAKRNGYDLNISEEELREKEIQNAEDVSICELIPKNSNTAFLYVHSLVSVDGAINYDCGEGQKIFNRKEYHPANKEEILDKELIESLISYTEKDCLKRGAKLSDDDYQMCWCKKIPISGLANEESKCIPFKTSTFLERLKREMNKSQNENSKVKYEYKCTCSNNKNKIIKGRYNSITGEAKVE